MSRSQEVRVPTGTLISTSRSPAATGGEEPERPCVVALIELMGDEHMRDLLRSGARLLVLGITSFLGFRLRPARRMQERGIVA